MTAAANPGTLSRLSMATPGTAVGSYTEIYEFMPESMQKKLEILDTQGISGTHEHFLQRSVDSIYHVSGQVNLQPGPFMLGNPQQTSGVYAANDASILTRIMGTGSRASSTWTPTESLTFFDVLVDKVEQRHIYGNCKVNRATFSAKAGGSLGLALDLVGETEALSATAFPSIASPIDVPYVWQQAVVVINSVTVVITEFQLTIDNKLQPRFSNSQTATDIVFTDRVVSLNAVVPYTSDYATLYGMNTGGAATATITFTNGGHSLVFTIGAYSVPDMSPVVSSKGEIFLKLQGTAKKTGATPSLTIANS